MNKEVDRKLSDKEISRLNSLSDDDIKKINSLSDNDIQKIKSLSDDDIQKIKSLSDKFKIIDELVQSTALKTIESIPISIFKNNRLSVMEAIVKYLKENKKFRYKKIAEILKRNAGPIGITYRNSKAKLSSELDTSDISLTIPFSIFSKKFTVFESTIVYLHDKEKIEFKEIASMLNRNYRTIWTVYQRAKNK